MSDAPPVLAWEVWFAPVVFTSLDACVGATVFGPTTVDDAIRLAAQLTGSGPRLHSATLVRVGNKDFDA